MTQDLDAARIIDAGADELYCGVGRCELSNAAQGVALAASAMRYSLYVPDVLVSVMRRCPGPGENFNRQPDCPCTGGGTATWNNPALPLPLIRRDNALYYRWDRLPADLDRLPINRIVYHLS